MTGWLVVQVGFPLELRAESIGPVDGSHSWTPASVYDFAQAYPVPTRQNVYISRQRRSRSRDYRLFRESMDLIRRHYVVPISEKDQFQRLLMTMSITLPPLCGEQVRGIDECDGDPEKCFIKAMTDIAKRCGLKRKELLLGALNQLLTGLDGNSALLDPRMLKEIKISTSGRFGGIGMVVARKHGSYIVVSSLEGSPSYRAGIHPGDRILEIDGEPIRGLDLAQVLQKVRGPIGSRMRLVLQSEGDGRIRTLRLKRKLIRIPPVRSTILNGDIGYLRIVNFQQATGKAVKRELAKLFRKMPDRLKGIILDLRGNPGGLFNQAIRVADLFLSSHMIISVRGRYHSLNRDFYAKRRGTIPQVPVVVLINRGSASAAEILAAALQSRSDVVVMGERSFGKASVQGVFPLGAGMALRLTTARYFAPDGRNIDGKGILPDILIDRSSNQEKAAGHLFLSDNKPMSDRWVHKAVQYLSRPPGISTRVFSTWY